VRLIIAPHVDDDVIGCGGILDKETVVYYCGVDDFHVVSKDDRNKEAIAASNIANYKFVWPINGPRVNYYYNSLNDLISKFTDLMYVYKPDEVYLPWPSYNQDHQTVYRAAMVALRPHDKVPFVPRVLLYEEPDCFWPGISEPFVPNYFKKIDIEKKVKLYEAMPSQIREHRPIDAIVALARVRGATIMQEFAEAFHILRWVG